MIDDNNLIQAAATVLAGVLIFLTFERHFEQSTEYQRKLDRLLDKRNDAIKEQDALRSQIKRITVERNKNIELSPSYGEDPVTRQQFENQIHRLNGQILKFNDEIQRLSQNMYSLTREHNQVRNRYTNLKTREGKVTLTMILFLSCSVIVMLFNIDPYVRPIASLMLIAGLALLTIRVYMHGRDAN